MRKYQFFLLLFLFTGFFTVCGLFLPKFLMDRQQNSLFAKTETMILPTITGSTCETFRKFPAEKLLQVAAGYGEGYLTECWLAYTPKEGQMTTEKLIQVAHQQIDLLCELEILPDLFSSEYYTYEGVQYKIPWQIDQTEGRSTELTDSDYSGWVVSGGNNDLSITVYINSVSGQILGLNASWNSTDSASIPRPKMHILEQYLKYLELEQEPVSYYEDSFLAECIFEDYGYALDVILESRDISLNETQKENSPEDTSHSWNNLHILCSSRPASSVQTDILKP